MQSSSFVYNGSSLGVVSFSGTGTEFINISAGLSKVWQMVSQRVAQLDRELASLQYSPVEGDLRAKLTNGVTYHVNGVRFHGELSSYDAGCKVLECITRLGL